MKKVGIMRINSYNKFFAKVAEIMNTSIKAVKQLDGRYKVELANHVYLNVYRGVSGNLFIHDHRGVAHITSCYDFDDFKTIKDLYDRLVSDYSDYSESDKKDVMEVKQELNARFGKEQYFDTDSVQANKIAKIENINHCPNQNTCCIVSPFVHCDYNYKSDDCIKAHKNFIHDCEQVHKQMKAKHNPEWHHVSLATLANIDFDMLDKKRQVYLKAHRELKRTLADLSKCKTAHTYEARARKFMRDMISQYYDNEISYSMRKYLDLQLSMSNVINGVWSSYVEPAMGLHESRRYSRPTLRY